MTLSNGTDTCPTWPTLLAWLENDLPDEEAEPLISVLVLWLPYMVLVTVTVIIMEGTSGTPV